MHWKNNLKVKKHLSSKDIIFHFGYECSKVFLGLLLQLFVLVPSLHPIT